MDENDELFTQFKDYTVRYEKLKLFERNLWAVSFRRPDRSSINSVDFLWDRGGLHVSGDLGSAMYWWGRNQPVGFFEKISLHYFHSKCESSDRGKLPYDWSEEKAKKRFKEMLEDHDVKEELYPPDLSGQFEWNIWLQENGWETFSDSYVEYSGIGEVISHRTKLHWAIIQLCARAVRDGVDTVRIEECPNMS